MTSSARWFFLFLATFLRTRQAFSLMRGRFSFLPALALLLGLFTLAPANAQTTIWTATLTVVENVAGALNGCLSTATSGTCADRLTDDNFEHGGETFVVTAIAASSSELRVRFDKTIPNSLKTSANLQVDSQTLAFSDGTLSSQSGFTNNIIQWSSSGTSWTANQQVSLRLTVPLDDTDPDDTDTPVPEFTLSATPDPVPWDDEGTITVTVEWPSDQDSESVLVNIREDGLCTWDDTTGSQNQATVNIPGGIRSEKEVGFNLARNEDYYNGGEVCPKENKEDCKKCFFTWNAFWSTGTARGVLALSILPPPGSGPPTGGVPPTGGGPSPTGGGPSPGGGGSPPGGPSDPIPDSDTPARCGENDREYLERFYGATGGDAWYRNENWKSEEPLGDWFGVETDENGEVVSLRLSDNGLSGEIPEELLSCLSDLKELALWDNEDLSGEVPEELALAVERAALRAIADMLNLNPEWFEDYEDPFDFEDWYEGVTTDDEERVTELELPGEIPESIRSQFKELREITITTSEGGCALSPEGSSAFSLFLLTLLVFSVLGRKRAR